MKIVRYGKGRKSERERERERDREREREREEGERQGGRERERGLTILSEAKEEVCIFKVMFVDNMMDVVCVDEKLSQFNCLFSRVRLTTGHKPVDELRS